MKVNDWHFIAGVLTTLCLLTNPTSGQNATSPVGTEQAVTSPAEEVVWSLDGTWEYETLDGQTGNVEVPCRWDRIEGLRSEHEVTFVRRFDLPSQFAHLGQRILVRCEAIGEFGELWINGKCAGGGFGGTASRGIRHHGAGVRAINGQRTLDSSQRRHALQRSPSEQGLAQPPALDTARHWR